MWIHHSYTATPTEVARLFPAEQSIQYDSLKILFPAYGEDGSYCASFWVNNVEYSIKSNISSNWEVKKVSPY